MENDAVNATEQQGLKEDADLVLREVWRIKDGLSLERKHDVHRLFAEARQRQHRSGRAVVTLHPARKPA